MLYYCSFEIVFSFLCILEHIFIFSTCSIPFLFSISEFYHLGVLLLNAVLTVVAHNANSHQGKVNGLLS